MSRKQRPALAQHLAWADTLRAFCRATQAMAVQIGNAFPVTSQEYRDADRATKALGRLRSTLENAAGRDLGADVFETHGLFYYGEPREIMKRRDEEPAKPKNEQRCSFCHRVPSPWRAPPPRVDLLAGPAAPGAGFHGPFVYICSVCVTDGAKMLEDQARERAAINLPQVKP